ncbi:MAG: helix-turn-helix domain-containing protein [Bacteroidales bacterium]|nr:helix-turn-helix domain-containing protein [Bacteroidales bacterium]
MSPVFKKVRWLPLLLVLPVMLNCSKDDYAPAPRMGIIAEIEGCDANIGKFCEDSTGSVWMLTGSHGLYRAIGQTLLHYTADSLDEGSLRSNFINDFATAPDGTLWIGSNAGIERYDPATDSFDYYELDTYDSNIRGILFDRDGQVYAESWRTLFKLDPDRHSFKTYLDFRSITHERIRSVFDRQGRLWVSHGRTLARFDASLRRDCDLSLEADCQAIVTFGENGLLLLDRNGHLHSIDSNLGQETSLPEVLLDLSGRTLTEMMEIGQDYLCFSSDKGVALYNRTKNLFQDGGKQVLAYDLVLARMQTHILLIDRDANLWSALPEGGYRVDKLHSLEDSPHNTLLQYLHGKTRRSIAMDDRFVWILLEDNKILTYDSDRKEIVDIADLAELTGSDEHFAQIQCGSGRHLLLNGRGNQSQQVIILLADEQGRPSFKCRYTASEPVAAGFDKEGGIWAFGVGSRILYGPPQRNRQQEIVLEPVEELPVVNQISYATRVFSLRDGRIVFGATNNNPLLLDPSVPSLSEIPVHEDNRRDYWATFFQDSRGDLWLSSSSFGLLWYRLSDNQDREVHRISNRAARNIREDDNGDILFISLDGKTLSRWKRSSEKIELLWSEKGALSNGQLLSLPDGSLFITNASGIMPFSQPEEDHSGNAPQTVIATLLSDDHVIESFSMLASEPTRRIHIRLKQQPDYPSLLLSTGNTGLGYTFDYQIDINHTGSSLAKGKSSAVPVSLQALHYGRNRILVRVRRTGSAEQGQAYTLFLHIRRPLWHWLLLTGVSALLIILLNLLRLLRKRSEENRQARKEKEMQERVNLRNIDFFANISHEFRAPLTLINGAISSAENAASPEERKRIHALARRNVARMLNLTSQLMDFNKLDHGQLALTVSRCDLSTLIRNIWESFSVGARQKNVDFHLIGCEQPHQGWADVDKLEKVLWNLLSNALKFTPPGGSVDLDVSCQDEILSVKVLDTGIGLDESQLPHLFDRFNQGRAGRQVGGTGIGLYYTKSLIDLHHGTIRAANRTDRRGSVFAFSLPVGESAYSESEKKPDADLQSHSLSARVASYDTGEIQLSSDGQELPSILIIDDDYDLVYYLRSLLAKDFRVLYRFDAMSGYNLIREEQPDVIICDVMMMDVSGMELCKMVKENLEICHIPIIMLTARSAVADQVKAFDLGANAYVVKPFEPGYLLALVRSMIENQRRLKQSLSFSTEAPAQEEADGLGPRDRQFMDRVYANLEDCMASGEIDIDIIAARTGVSRSKLFYKIKALTGQTPGEFFTSYRLNRAAQLLLEEKYKISAVAIMTGFNSSSHFAALFRKHFGILPSQYIQRQREST